MTNNDIVLEALRASGRPMASHQLYEHPACEGLTRQQVSSAVGHLRNLGRIKETWERVPGPRFGPKLVSTYEVIPSEAELDAALVAALAASVTPDPDSPAGQAEASRLAAARVPPAARPIRRTSITPPQAATHPFKQPLVPKAARHGRITRDLPGHLRTPDPDPDGATQEAQYIAAGAAAEAEAEAEAAAETVADATTTPEAATSAEATPGPIATPTEDTAIAAKTHHCTGQCLGPDQGKTARYAPQGDPCAAHAADDLEPADAAPALVAEEIRGVADDAAGQDEAEDRPAWVAALQDWLGPLPVDLSLYQMGARLMPNDGPGELRLKINDDGGGPFLRLDAQKLALNPGELGRLDRYSRALVWIFDAIQANSEEVERIISRPAGLDQPNIDDLFAAYPDDAPRPADHHHPHAPF